MFVLKAHYLFWFGSLSGFLPYVSIFARQHLNSSAEAIGILYGVLPFIVSFVKPLVCSIADRYQRHSLVLLIAQSFMTFGFGLLILIPYIIQWIDQTILFAVFCVLTFVANTAMGAGVSLSDYLVIQEVVRANQQGREYVNYGEYRIWGTIGFGIGGILAGLINDRSEYLPYLIPGLIMFVALEFLDISFIYKFYHLKQMSTRSYLPETELTEQPKDQNSTPNGQTDEKTSIMNIQRENTIRITEESSGLLCEVLITGFKSIYLIFFQIFKLFFYYPTLIQLSFIVFCFGILTAFHWSFFFWFLEEIRGKDTLLMGLCIAVEAFIGEIPIFYVAHHIIRKFGSILSLCIALGAFAVRYIAYGYWLVKDKNGPYFDILLIEATQGLTFSLFYSVMTHVAQYYAEKCESIELTPTTDEDNENGQRSSKKRTKIIKPSATMQGLMSASFEGTGLGTGALIGGFITKKYGVQFIWRFGAFLSIGMIVLNVCIELIKFVYKRQHPKRPRQQPPQQMESATNFVN